MIGDGGGARPRGEPTLFVIVAKHRQTAWPEAELFALTRLLPKLFRIISRDLHCSIVFLLYILD